MDAPLCNCGCGEVVERRSYETDNQWRRREKLGIFRDKCKRTLKPIPSPKDRPTLVADPTAWNLERVEGKEQPKEKPVVDEAYRKFVRSFPCLIRGCGRPSVFHHQNQKGHGRKGGVCTDYRGVNLCEWHHTLGGTEYLPGSYHGDGKVTGWKFWQLYGIDVETVVHDLNRAWLEMGRTFK